MFENAFEVVLGNAAHIRTMLGRKTDVNDAMWIADLLAHGLICSSLDSGVVRSDMDAQTTGRRD
ncbi:hypothetical protein [Burkholderia lata]|uniref:hypothetical protein n=1 Tax=Burkholderia lata (strain ATCC 17760 / DSM 23089 / LMG 22485 / NCIMB 9086 / R18194 / 383) TaxID=482957 RepID=UPI003F5C834F